MTEGIITGVIASGIFVALSFAVKQWVWPMYVAAIYKGYRVEGDWDAYFNDSNEISATFRFKQYGTEIVGESMITRTRSGEAVHRKYRCEGRCLSRSIILTFEDEHNPLLMGGAMVLHYIDSDANQMKAKSIYLKPETNNIEVTSAILKKRV